MKPTRQVNDIIRHQPVQRKNSTIRIKKKWVITVGSIVVLALIGGLAMYSVDNARQQAVKPERYQAVYLTTGQIYFGHLQNTKGEYLTVKGVYTVQSNASEDATATEAKQTSIVKVSDQVYGPEDEIAIRSDQVLFWQNLKADSKVSKAIDSRK
jgi:hypothetical protein